MRGDDFDDVIAAKVSDLGVRGAAIAYFNKNTMTTPVTRGYGQISSISSSSVVTPDTAFTIASISKTFVASAIAVLVDRGIISIDDNICDVIPEDYSAQMCHNPKHPNKTVTWRMLMTHRSSMKRSLPDTKNQSGDWICPSCGPSGSFYADFKDTGNPTCPMDGVVDFYHALLTDDIEADTIVGAGVKLESGKDLNWYELATSEGGMWMDYEPGAKGEYSNAAYGYLPALIELATGQSFPEFSRDNLFAPLGMDTTAWFREDLPDGTLEVIPVKKKNRGGFRDVGHYCYIDYGSGSLRTTANDLAAWGHSMLEYGAPTLWSNNIGHDIVKCQERDENNEPVQTSCEFGYGWALLNNSMKGRRTRHLDESDDDSTEAPTSSTSSSESSSESIEEPTDAPTSISSSTSSSGDSSIESSNAPWWLEDGFSRYDWTDGMWHDGSEEGVRTNMIILPKAGVYVAVLLNTNESGEEAEELTAAIMNAPQPSSFTSQTVMEELRDESSSVSWRSPSFFSVLARVAFLLVTSHLLAR